MELKARLATLENQINSLQAILVDDQNYNPSSANINLTNQDNLKSILMKLKHEHQAVLQNIEKALEIVDYNSSNIRTPDRSSSISTNIRANQSPSSPRLREKINSLFHNSSSPVVSVNRRPLNSSPLTPAVEKSHITFDILNELDSRESNNKSGLNDSSRKKRVHFNSSEDEGTELSMASREYLKKYGLL